MLTEAEGIKFPSCYKYALYDGFAVLGSFSETDVTIDVANSRAVKD